jgi:hypothetical protein
LFSIGVTQYTVGELSNWIFLAETRLLDDRCGCADFFRMLLAVVLELLYEYIAVACIEDA